MAIGRLVIPLYTQMLEALLGQLHKAAATRETDHDLVRLGECCLAPDMSPLFDHIRLACSQAAEVVARLQGGPLPVIERPKTLVEAEETIGAALMTIDSARGSKIDDAAATLIRLDHDDGLSFVLSGEEYVRDWALPQFHFHLVTAYAIMRASGVPLGKVDYAAHMFRYLERPEAATGTRPRVDPCE